MSDGPQWYDDIWKSVSKFVLNLTFWNDFRPFLGLFWLGGLGHCYEVHTIRNCLLYCLLIIFGPFVISDLNILVMGVPTHWHDTILNFQRTKITRWPFGVFIWLSEGGRPAMTGAFFLEGTLSTSIYSNIMANDFGNKCRTTMSDVNCVSNRFCMVLLPQNQSTGRFKGQTEKA